jgi:hypothetical protein
VGITRANNAGAIENALARQQVVNLQFSYYDLPAWALGWKRAGRGVRSNYVLWQWGAYRVARRLCRAVRFDVVHHLTFGAFRHPFHGLLGVPFVFQPMAAADRRGYPNVPAAGRVIDGVQDLANWTVQSIRWWRVCRRSAAILCKTGRRWTRSPRVSTSVASPGVGIDPGDRRVVHTREQPLACCTSDDSSFGGVPRPRGLPLRALAIRATPAIGRSREAWLRHERGGSGWTPR